MIDLSYAFDDCVKEIDLLQIAFLKAKKAQDGKDQPIGSNEENVLEPPLNQKDLEFLNKIKDNNHALFFGYKTRQYEKPFNILTLE